jgi:putative phage-type endonuclease
MLCSDLDPLECILHKIIAEEVSNYIPNIKDETDLVEICLHLMYEYISENPTAISDPDFEEDLIYDVKELIIIHFEGDPFFNDEAEEDIDEIIYIALDMFYQQFMPRRAQNGTYEIARSPKQIKALEKQIKALSSLEQPEQRTPEWYQFRHKLITASNAYKAFENQTVQNQLIYEKCQPLFVPQNDSEFTFTSVNTTTTLHWGQKYEPLSVMIYEADFNTKVGDFGCIQHDQYLFLGASPDGINIDKSSPNYGRMLEIKNIVNREINGNPKKEYWIQMQLQMETCNLDECDFLETKFVEYSDIQSFNEDSTPDEITTSKDGSKKGIIIQFQASDGKPFYAYKPLDLITQDEIDQWEEETLELYQSEEYNYVLVKFIYWKLEEMSCVLVLRNKQWFQDNIEQLQNIWTIIEEERKNGYSHRAPNKRSKKESNDEFVQNNSGGCLLNIKDGKSVINVIKIRTESFDETKASMNT